MEEKQRTIKYLIWNNKGGVGKTTLTFHASCSAAKADPNRDVLVLDLCPQANVSFLLIKGRPVPSGYPPQGQKGDDDEEDTDHVVSDELPLLNCLIGKQKAKNKASAFDCSVLGYLSSVIQKSPSEPEDYLIQPRKGQLDNLWLLCGDIRLDLLVSFINERMGNKPLPGEEPAWCVILKTLSRFANDFAAARQRPLMVFIDCSPQFNIFTQMAVASADFIVLPFRPDILSIEGLKNVMRLVYAPNSSLQFPSQFRENCEKYNMSMPKIRFIVGNALHRREKKKATNASFLQEKKKPKQSGMVREFGKLFNDVVDQCFNWYSEHPEWFACPENLSRKHFKRACLRCIYDFNACSVVTLTKCIPLVLLDDALANIGKGCEIQSQKDFTDRFGVTKLQLGQAKELTAFCSELATSGCCRS